MSDFCGFILVIFSYFVLAHCKNIRKNQNLLIACVVALTLHHLVAIYNAYFGVTFGAGTDAKTFYRTATELSHNIYQWQFAIGAPFYRYILAWFFKIFGASIFLGEELSVFAFTLSCILFVKIAEILSINKNLPLLMLIFGCLPSMLCMGSVILREPWQIMLFMSATYFALNNLDTGTLSSWFGFIFSTCCLALFHEGLVIFIFLLCSIYVLARILNWLFNYHTNAGKDLYFIVLTIETMILIFLLLSVFMSQAPELEAFHAISEGNPLNFVSYFRHAGIQTDTRTSYGVIINSHDTLSFVHTFIPTYLNYMFAPFPWNINNILDLYAMFESTLRFALLITSLVAVFYSIKKRKIDLIFLLSGFLLMSSLWSLGTLNYGTSIRHHLVSFWLLLLISGSALSKIESKQSWKFKSKLNKLMLIKSQG